ncbi:MAG TPA: AMP-binding protein [Anaerolineales bacterium]
MAFITDLSQLIPHLAANASGFSERLSNAGVDPDSIRTASDLDSLPVIRKDDLAGLQAADPPFGGYLACEPHELKRIYQSPGPIYDPESRISDYWRWAPALRAAGFQAGDVVLNAFGYHLTPAGAMFEEGLWAVGCTVIPAGVGNQDGQIQAMATLDISGYVGLPSYLKALIDKAAEMEVSLELKKAFVTAEPLPPSLRRAINQHGITIRQGYGTAECGNLGYECEQEDGWHLPEDAIIQVCDINSGESLQPGEIGEIVVTLYTADYALVRFGTGDLSTLNIEACPCGRATPRLMGWRGRVGDAVKVRGMFLHPHQLAGLMSRFPEVVRWQAVINRREHKDYLTLRVIPKSVAESANLASRLVEAAKASLRLSIGVDILSPEALPQDADPIQDTRTWE